MSKTTKTILILIFILIIAIVGFLFYKSKTKEPIINPITSEPFVNPFNPKEEPIVPPEEDPNEIEWVKETPGQKSKFYQITSSPVAGGIFFEEEKVIINPVTNTKEIEIIPALRYVERINGHVYQMNLDTKDTTKISNSTIPNVYEVLINKLANTFVYRYVSNDNVTITSFVAQLGSEKGEFLPSNVINMSLSPDKTKAFYLVKNASGVVGFTLSFEDNKKSQIFTSSFSEWSSQWVNNQEIFLTTKPSWSVAGSLFSLDIKNGNLTKIFGGVEGLTTLANKDGSFVLYGASLSTGPKLWILNSKEHTTKDLNTFGLPEKCVWSTDGVSVYCAVPNTVRGTQYPDSWYQGLYSFDDYFVKINTKTLEKITLANSKNEIPIDAVSLFLDKEEDALFFTNKKDSTLWSLEL